MSTAPKVNFEADAKPPKPAKKAKKARKAPRRASFQKPDKPAAPFPGMTRTLCAAACSATGCAISGKGYCAHPTKGGLHETEMKDHAALTRMQQARDQIDVRLDPDRFK